MYALSLETDGSGWLGTFSTAVSFIAADLLSDGAPVDDVVVHRVEGKGSIAGVLTDADASEGTITVSGQTIPAREIFAFRILS